MLKAKQIVKPWVIIIVALLLAGSAAARAGELWSNWPTGTDPAEVGQRLIKNLIARKPAVKPYGYPESCMAYGSMRFAAAIKDPALLKMVEDRYAVILTPEGKKLMRKEPANEDAAIEGIIPLELYQQTGDAGYLAIGKGIADFQWSPPTRRSDGATSRPAKDSPYGVTPEEIRQWTAEGLSKQTRFWIDDMFMITALQVEAYRATGDKIYLDRAATEMAAYIDKLQRPDGLFYHHANAPIHWGRGNGWVAAGMTEVLLELPKDHPLHGKIMTAYQKMMAALVKDQDSAGMWHEVIDDPKAWPESSCTAMFTFALAEGYRNGWLQGDQYQNAARNGWIALCGHLDKDANLTDVCVGTNPGATEQHYLDRGQETGNLHGQAALIWAAWALLPEQGGKY
ncbi:MAG TPA: glycoside hydrolase family 88 protein [Tepidisphaeraceae bacterium]|nr:glycoside hydrolase family 88 protein [Tepidisphaeraceae bacterium]